MEGCRCKSSLPRTRVRRCKPFIKIHLMSRTQLQRSRRSPKAKTRQGAGGRWSSTCTAFGCPGRSSSAWCSWRSNWSRWGRPAWWRSRGTSCSWCGFFSRRIFEDVPPGRQESLRPSNGSPEEKSLTACRGIHFVQKTVRRECLHVDKSRSVNRC